MEKKKPKIVELYSKNIIYKKLEVLNRIFPHLKDTIIHNTNSELIEIINRHDKALKKIYQEHTIKDIYAIAKQEFVGEIYHQEINLFSDINMLKIPNGNYLLFDLYSYKEDDLNALLTKKTKHTNTEIEYYGLEILTIGNHYPAFDNNGIYQAKIYVNKDNPNIFLSGLYKSIPSEEKHEDCLGNIKILLETNDKKLANEANFEKVKLKNKQITNY